jgi:catechol 2,3-dioxygenase
VDTTTIDSGPDIKFGPRRLAHGTFFVSDLQASTQFYTEICGLNLVFEEPGISAVFLSNGNTHHDIALVETSPAERLGKDGQVQVPRGRGGTPGLNHLGFEMETEQELVCAYRRAVDARLPIHRTADHQVAHSVYLFDSDGNYLEFYADATRDWRGVFERAGNAPITGVWNPGSEPATTDVRYDPAPNLTARQGSILSPRRSARATLNVRDLAEAIAFYQRVAGMTVLRSDDTSADFAGTAGNACLRLREVAAGSQPGLDSFGFEVSGDQEFEEASRRLDHAGIPRVQDTSHAESTLVVRDPDGLKLEFFIRAQN